MCRGKLVRVSAHRRLRFCDNSPSFDLPSPGPGPSCRRGPPGGSRSLEGLQAPIEGYMDPEDLTEQEKERQKLLKATSSVSPLAPLPLSLPEPVFREVFESGNRWRQSGAVGWGRALEGGAGARAGGSAETMAGTAGRALCRLASTSRPLQRRLRDRSATSLPRNCQRPRLTPS